jgi:hypothetical protein
MASVQESLFPPQELARLQVQQTPAILEVMEEIFPPPKHSTQEGLIPLFDLSGI